LIVLDGQGIDVILWMS
jgi:hypothetical protein